MTTYALSIGTGSVTTGVTLVGPFNTTGTVAAAVLLWNVRLSDGTVFVVEASSAMAAHADAVAAECAWSALGRQPRRVVEVTSA